MKRHLVVPMGILLVLIVLFTLFVYSNRAKADISVFAAPIQAGCYIVAPNDCRIHAEPFTITVNQGSRLVFFSLVTNQQGTGTQRVVYNFKPDLSNPVPLSGTTFTPSLVTQDFGATCGATYNLSLQARDTLDPNPYNLGTTGYFTCPPALP